MIKYDKLWVTMKSKGVTQYDLTQKYNLSKSLLHRLRNNEGISMNSINTLCNILDCNISQFYRSLARYAFVTSPSKYPLVRGKSPKTPGITKWCHFLTPFLDFDTAFGCHFPVLTLLYDASFRSVFSIGITF